MSVSSGSTDLLPSPAPISRLLPPAIPGPGAQGRRPGNHPVQRPAQGSCRESVRRSWVGRKRCGAGWVGKRSGRAYFILPATGHIPRELAQATQHCTVVLSKIHLAGQLGGVIQHLCATLRPQPTHSGRYSTNACHSLTWERCVFSKPLVNQSETGLLPILNLYGGFLPELACTHT